MTQDNLGTAFSERVRGDRADNLEQAIACHRAALEVYTRQAHPLDWATTQDNLGTAFSERVRGDRADNLEQAIACYQAAVEVRTRAVSPWAWADTQHNLAVAYLDRIRGNRAANLERAIAALQAALEVYTRAESPLDWATAQVNLGTAYRTRIGGDRAENLEQAIACYHAALQVYTRKALPIDWAMTQGSLGAAFSERVRGDRADNLERAIACHQAALQVRTRDALPRRWAMTQLALGNVYRARLLGDRADNLERAIACYHAALQVYTREALPLEWAATQHNLGAAFAERLQGDRADNLEQAIACYHAALEVRTREALPLEWAATHDNLGTAYRTRVPGDPAHNLDRAIACHHAALEVFVSGGLPASCRRAGENLANACAEAGRWEDAASGYQVAVDAAGVLYAASLLRSTREAELTEAGDLHARAAVALAHAGRLPEAVITLEQGRARGLSDALARDQTDLADLERRDVGAYKAYRHAAERMRRLEATERGGATLPTPTIGTGSGAGTADAEARESAARGSHAALHQQAAAARDDLAAAIERVRRVQGFERFLTPLGFADIQAAAAPSPLVYLAVTAAGGLALIVGAPAAVPAGGRTSVTALWLPTLTGPAVRARVHTFRAAHNRRYRQPAAWRGTVDAVTSWLWAAMGPVLAALAPATAATLIPGGLLGLLPLHAAWTADPAAATGRRYALDVLALSYAPNARSLAAAGAIAKRVGDDALLAVEDPRPVAFAPLRFATPEVDAARARFAKTAVLAHTAATSDRVSELLPAYTVQHLACHGIAKLDAPLDGGLVLAGGQMLRLRDILDLRLAETPLGGARLAVLSACETHLPGIKLPDEVVSLPAGLLQAGLAGVVASQWAVRGLPTALLMARFYQHWKGEGAAPSQALRDAQRWLRDSTNGEKAALLNPARRAAVGMPAATARVLWRELIRRPASARDFAHPTAWAAFAHVGI
jgi:CHAT domain-containing protein/tetratricopeptide (TPR) repeat protein